MAVRPEFRWLILTLVIVGVLLSISALALDRPNVVWMDGQPHCPSCMNGVEAYATRCPHCTERFDWLPTRDEEGALSPYSLSPFEAELLRERIQTLGAEVAARRTSEALALSLEDATAYLESVGRGRCGWCGGTGRELGAEPAQPCSCGGPDGSCIACGGDRRIELGNRSAHNAYLRYRESLQDLGPGLPEELRLAELQRRNAEFLRDHRGTHEATLLLAVPGGGNDDRLVMRARRRLDKVLVALGAD